MLALLLHLTLGFGTTLAGWDLKLIVIVSELGGILLAALTIATLLRLPLATAFALRPAAPIHYIVALVAALPLQLAAGAMQEQILDALPNGELLRQTLKEAMDRLVRANEPLDFLWLFLGGVLLAAACEEALFRGLILQLLARRGRWLGAIASSAILFSALHFDPIGLLPRFLVGAYLGMLVWRSGSLYPAVVAHGANNLIAFAAIPLAVDVADPERHLLLGLGSAIVFVLIVAVYLRRTATEHGASRQ